MLRRPPYPNAPFAPFVTSDTTSSRWHGLAGCRPGHVAGAGSVQPGLSSNTTTFPADGNSSEIRIPARALAEASVDSQLVGSFSSLNHQRELTLTASRNLLAFITILEISQLLATAICLSDSFHFLGWKSAGDVHGKNARGRVRGT